MYRSCFALPLFLFLFACQNTSFLAEESSAGETAPPARYTPSDIQKMRWLAGMWTGREGGRPVRQSFQFHGGNALEILLPGSNGEMDASPFVWREGRYYYGQQYQWIVTWIGEKDVRFDPVRTGFSPMTWTRQNDRKWLLVRHLPGGDDVTEMEYADGMNP